jgi:MOSC domain-containing protein YiiM
MIEEDEKIATDVKAIDSNSVGNPGRFRSLADLERMLQALPRGNEDKGRVALLMRRVEGGRRELLEGAVLAPDTGVPGDAWCRAAQPNPDMQIAVMQKDVAEFIANGQPLALFGDALILDLDLSTANLPAGSRVRVGGAILEVTPMPHNGCRKFHARFGNDALRFVSMKELRHRNLRGIYMRVAEPGAVRTGDPVDVVSRASTAPAEG